MSSIDPLRLQDSLARSQKELKLCQEELAKVRASEVAYNIVLEQLRALREDTVLAKEDAVQIMSKTQFRDYQWLVGKTVQESLTSVMKTIGLMAAHIAKLQALEGKVITRTQLFYDMVNACGTMSDEPIRQDEPDFVHIAEADTAVADGDDDDEEHAAEAQAYRAFLKKLEAMKEQKKSPAVVCASRDNESESRAAAADPVAAIGKTVLPNVIRVRHTPTKAAPAVPSVSVARDMPITPADLDGRLAQYAREEELDTMIERANHGVDTLSGPVVEHYTPPKETETKSQLERETELDEMIERHMRTSVSAMGTVVERYMEDGTEENDVDDDGTVRMEQVIAERARMIAKLEVPQDRGVLMKEIEEALPLLEAYEEVARRDHVVDGADGVPEVTIVMQGEQVPGGSADERDREQEEEDDDDDDEEEEEEGDRKTEPRRRVSFAPTVAVSQPSALPSLSTTTAADVPVATESDPVIPNRRTHVGTTFALSGVRERAGDTSPMGDTVDVAPKKVSRFRAALIAERAGEQEQ